MARESGLAQLFKHYMDGTASPEQSYDFIKHCNDPANELELKALMDAYLDEPREADGMEASQQERVFLQLFEKARASAQKETVILPIINPAKKTLPFWKKMISAAAILLIISVPAYLYVTALHKKAPVYTAYHGAIKPGSNKAVLTLSSGKKIVLNDAANGQLALQQGVKVSKTADGTVCYEVLPAANTAAASQYNSIATPAGGQYQLILPDGSRVWLNALSELRFTAAFTAGLPRRVLLSGEAYFEVAQARKDGARTPFTVSSKGQDVTVLGTHFNINAYGAAEGTRTTLLEGSVAVSRQGAFSQVLKPGQQSTVASGILVNQVDTNMAVAWKNGLFRFDNENLKEVMSQLSRWYDVDIAYEGAIPRNRFSGELYRNMNADKILQILKLSDIGYRVEAPQGSAASHMRKKIVIFHSNLTPIN